MIQIHAIPKDHWVVLSESAHKAVFGEIRPADKNRVDFSLLATDENDTPLGYIAVQEVDAETVYWQFGGSFESMRGTILSYQACVCALEWTKSRYKRVWLRVRNDNLPMLKLAMKTGFRIVGVKNCQGQILVEHELEFGGTEAC